jgi:hypothetical protein
MSNEIVMTDEMKLDLYRGELTPHSLAGVDLPGIYAQSRLRLENAKSYTDLQFAAVDLVDIKTVDADFMEGLMFPIRELRSLLAEAGTEVEAERKPSTTKADAIKSLFTAIEKGFKDLGIRCSALENKWETEKFERARLAEIKKNSELLKANERALLVQRFTNGINRALASQIVEDVAKARAAYYSKTADELAEFGQALNQWAPELTDADLTAFTAPEMISRAALQHKPEEVKEILDSVVSSIWPAVKAEYKVALEAEITTLVTFVPTQIDALRAGEGVTVAEVEQSTAAFAEAKSQELQDKELAAEATAEVDGMNAAFDIAANTSVYVGPSKGTRVKKKYQVDSHKGMAAIIQQWVAREMPLMSVTELEKRLSFMVTAANVRLNKDERIEASGLKIVDDISTVRRKTSA